MDTEALENLGLTKNEAKVYVTILELGRAHTGEIAEKTRMHRRTIYDCLERLEDRGLAGHVVEEKTRYFSPMPPQKLMDIAKEREACIAALLPKLIEVAGQSRGRTEVTVHKGKEGLKSIMQDMLLAGPKEWLSLTSAAKASVVIPFYLGQFHDLRIKANVPLRIIFGHNPQSMRRAKELKVTPLTYVGLIENRYIIPLSLWIYADRVAFMLWESETGILIENRETADTFRTYFEMLWRISKKI